MCSDEVLLGVSYNLLFLHLILSAQNNPKNYYVGEYLCVHGTCRTPPRILMHLCGIIGLNLHESFFTCAPQKRNPLTVQANKHPTLATSLHSAAPSASTANLCTDQTRNNEQ